MEVEGLRDGSSPPDSSKDLEKDEREWKLNAPRAGILHITEGPDLDAPTSITVVSKDRLQQVEAERDRLIRTGEETERYLGGKLQAAEDRDCRLADELSIAREALEEIGETYALGDPNPAADANHLRSLARAVLARLQAKEEGT